MNSDNVPGVHIGGREEPSDEELMAGVRDGDQGAITLLYARHRPAALATARALTGRANDSAEDCVHDAFAAVLGAIGNGKGPDDNFRAYLLTAVRNQHSRNSKRAQRVTPTDELDLFDRPTHSVSDPAEQAQVALDAQLVLEAFRSLPDQWQRILWRAEVDGLPPRQLANEFGVSANTAAALAYRARKGLAQAFLRAHLKHGVPARCGPIAPKLAAWVRGELNERNAVRITAHVADCQFCSGLAAELGTVNSALRAVSPVLVSVPALAAYATSHTARASDDGHSAGEGSVPSEGARTNERTAKSKRPRHAAAVLLVLGIGLAFTLTTDFHRTATVTQVLTRPPRSDPAPTATSPERPHPARQSLTSALATPSVSPSMRVTTAPTASPPNVVFSTAPAPHPLQITISELGASRTFIFATDMGAYTQPVLRVHRLPAGWNVTLSGSPHTSCSTTWCTFSRNAATTYSISIGFSPSTTASAGTAHIDLYASPTATSPTQSYPVQLST